MAHSVGIIASEFLFEDSDVVLNKVRDVADLLAYQYGDRDIIFNLHGSIGVPLDFGIHCIDKYYKCDVFLPDSIEKTSEHWFDDQKSKIRTVCGSAYGITVSNNGTSGALERLVDNSSFVVVFWAGNKQGRVYDAIKYAFKKNKIVLDGMKGLGMLTNGSLKKHK